MNLREEIRELIKSGVTDDVNQRVNVQERISGYLVYLQSEEEKAFAKYKEAYQARKIMESQCVFDSNQSVSKANASAAFICRSERKAETQAEIKYEGFKLFRMSTQTHLQMMVQKTSHLKYEHQNG